MRGLLHVLKLSDSEKSAQVSHITKELQDLDVVMTFLIALPMHLNFIHLDLPVGGRVERQMLLR